jgi:hypothetical protein
MLVNGFIHGSIVSILMFLAIYISTVFAVNELTLQIIIYFLLYVPAVIVGYLYRSKLKCSLLELLLTNNGMKLYLYQGCPTKT